MLKRKTELTCLNKAGVLYHMLRWLTNKMAGGGWQIRGEECMPLSNKWQPWIGIDDTLATIWVMKRVTVVVRSNIRGHRIRVWWFFLEKGGRVENVVGRCTRAEFGRWLKEGNDLLDIVLMFMLNILTTANLDGVRRWPKVRHFVDLAAIKMWQRCEDEVSGWTYRTTQTVILVWTSKKSFYIATATS